MDNQTTPQPKVFEIKAETPRSTEFTMGDHTPHTTLLETISSLSRGKPQKNLKQIIINPVTRQKRVAMAMFPSWSTHHAPYNTARLLGLAKASGFASRGFDFNVEAYSQTDRKDLWHTYQSWRWENPERYKEDIHPHIEHILLKQIDQLVEFRPDVLGVSVYFCNNQTLAWVIPRIKERLPNIKIVAGGSQVIQGKLQCHEMFDYIVSGEGEEIFLMLLEKIENDEPITDRFFFHPKSQRIDLDSMPWPDYSDFDLSLYQFGTAIGSEISRGCIAKCEYCAETHFWKYRGRVATTVVDEFEYHYNTFGVRTVHFIDSLVNGNLKELRAFALGVVAKGMNELVWAGYARSDGRMDLAYLQDLANSGCQMLNFGAETGSNRVLDLMSKNVTREEMEQNFIDLKKVGIKAYTNWIVGFPGERIDDLAQTFIFLWRNRDTGISHYSLNACNDEAGTPLKTDPQKFNISTTTRWGGKWVSNDLTNTPVHRLIRYKTYLIFASHMRRHLRHIKFNRDGWGLGGMERYGLEAHYTFEYDKHNARNIIDYDDFDYNVLKINVNPVADTVVNEIWPLLRVLFLAWGKYKISINFDHDQDQGEFGGQLMIDPGCPGEFNSKIQFEIDDDGNWHAVLDYKFTGIPGSEFDLHFDETGKWERTSYNASIV